MVRTFTAAAQEFAPAIRRALPRRQIRPRPIVRSKFFSSASCLGKAAGVRGSGRGTGEWEPGEPNGKENGGAGAQRLYLPRPHGADFQTVDFARVLRFPFISNQAPAYGISKKRACVVLTTKRARVARREHAYTSRPFLG